MGEFIVPDWPAPAGVRALITTRADGVSDAPFDSLNLGDHVGDRDADVLRNRTLLGERAELPGAPFWLSQVHGCDVVSCGPDTPSPPAADAATTRERARVCAVLTADCLPLLICDRTATQVAAVHAGWRGLAAGVVERTLQRFDAGGDALMVWLGPAIGPAAFEVGDEVRDAFVGEDPFAAQAFVPSRPGHWLADLYRLARLRLERAGVDCIGGGDYCTFSDSARFFSYRRDGRTGRMASLIWLE